jgi:RNA polymerase sigma factor (sigma-70 family)
MTNTKFTLSVFNTCTNAYENVEVTQEVYTTVRRGEWNGKKRDRRFYRHEIQMSVMICGDDGDVSSFKEFASNRENPEEQYLRKETRRSVQSALSALSKDECALITALFLDEKTEREYSRETGIPQKTINRRKALIVNKLRTLLKKEEKSDSTT